MSDWVCSESSQVKGGFKFQIKVVLFAYLLRLKILPGKRYNLHRGEPQRECASIVFQQNAKEALDGAEHRAVDHDGPLLRVVCVCIFLQAGSRFLL